MNKGIGGHQSARMINDNWLTPPEIIKALGHFDLDPCTPDIMPWKTASNRFTKAQNGLKQEWFGRVWLNPPYSREAVRWLNRLSQHGNGIALIFARTETDMFFSEVWGKANSILFIKGRLYFFREDGIKAKANSGAPSCLNAYGQNNSEILKSSGIPGKFLSL